MEGFHWAALATITDSHPTVEHMINVTISCDTVLCELFCILQ